MSGCFATPYLTLLLSVGGDSGGGSGGLCLDGLCDYYIELVLLHIHFDEQWLLGFALLFLRASLFCCFLRA